MRRSALSFGQAAVSRVYLAARRPHPGLAGALEAEFGLGPVALSARTLFPTVLLWGGATTRRRSIVCWRSGKVCAVSGAAASAFLSSRGEVGVRAARQR